MKISQATKFLETAYEKLNKKYFENTLSKITITIQSSKGAYGHFTTFDAWRNENKKTKEINLGAETLSRPIAETIGTLIHEMVHFYCYLNNIKDTSRGGTYHNKAFKTEAEKRGIIIGYSKKIGHSPTTPSQELKDYCIAQGWQDLTLYRTEPTTKPTEKKKSSTRIYVCSICGQRIRATKDVKIACGLCSNFEENIIVYLEKENKDEEN